jgi:hypothetical protein
MVAFQMRSEKKDQKQTGEEPSTETRFAAAQKDENCVVVSLK